MLATAFLSMWISNTATTAMMIPIIEAVLTDLDAAEQTDKKTSEKRKIMMMLSVAFAANIGGTGTLIGTGSLMVLYEYMTDYEGNPITFGAWMAFAIPSLIVNLLLCWIWLQLFCLGLPCFKSKEERAIKKLENVLDVEDSGVKKSQGVKALLQSKYKELGSMSFHESGVLFLFICLMLHILSDRHHSI